MELAIGLIDKDTWYRPKARQIYLLPFTFYILHFAFYRGSQRRRRMPSPISNNPKKVA